MNLLKQKRIRDNTTKIHSQTEVIRVLAEVILKTSKAWRKEQMLEDTMNLLMLEEIANQMVGCSLAAQSASFAIEGILDEDNDEPPF